MAVTISGDIKQIRSNIAKAVVNPFFLGKINLKKSISEMATCLDELGGEQFIQECERLFAQKNSEIEHKIVSDHSGILKDDLKPLIQATQIKKEQVYVLHKSWAELKEEDIRNLLPEDKLILNKEIFYDRLKGVEFRDIPLASEKKIMEDLMRDSIGLSKEEVILYYNLLKIYRLSIFIQEGQQQKKTDDLAMLQKMTDTFINSFIPKIISLEDLKNINDGTAIDRESYKDSLIDKIKTSQVNLIPYITLSSIGQGVLINHAKEIIQQVAQHKNISTDILWNSFIALILFQNTSPNFIELLKLSNNIINILNNKIGKLPQAGLISIIFIHAVFLNLCKNIGEIRSKYQKSDEENRKKLYKLYGDNERLAMIVNASIDIAFKNLDLHKGETSELSETIKRYSKNKPILDKNLLFG